MLLPIPLIELGRVPEAKMDAIRQALDVTTEAEWLADTDRQRSFACHRDTQTIPFVYGRNTNVLTRTAAWSDRWCHLLLPALEPLLRAQYGEGEIIRSCLVNLLPHGRVLEHKDDTEEILLHTHRVHLPIKTNPDVDFVIEDVVFKLEYGHVYEFSNQVFHYVSNRSAENRVHLIFDYMESHMLADFRRRHAVGEPVIWATSYRDPALG